LICWGNDRNEVLKRMERALLEYHIAGVITNIPFLKIILKNEKFIRGIYDINFVEREIISLQENSNLNKNNNELEIAASIIAAILKSNSVSYKREQITSENKWIEQIND